MGKGIIEGDPVPVVEAAIDPVVSPSLNRDGFAVSDIGNQFESGETRIIFQCPKVFRLWRFSEGLLRFMHSLFKKS